MKRLIFLLALLAHGGWNATAWAQKPRLNEMTFRVDGKTATCTTGEIRVAVTMVFNTAMRDSIPVITFGLNAPYPTPLPLITKTWVNTTTFVASFDINNRVPPTADGLYKFFIRKAYAADGDTLTPVLSDTLKNGSNQPSTLYISRTGKLTATTTKVEFGAIKAGASFDKTLVVRNATCAEVFLIRFTLSDPFTVVNPPVGARVLPDANVTLNLRFSSPLRRAYAGVIKINYTSNSQPDSLIVQLTGTTRGPEMIFVPSPALNFGALVVGDSAAKSFRVTNRKAENAALSDTLKIFSAALNPIAGYNQTPLPAAIAPGDTKSVTIKFKPTEGRIYNSSLSFTTNDLIKPLGKISFPVNGSGQILQPPPRVDTLLVTWPAGRAGYTNVDSLTIYLNLTAANVAEVLEARWKFSFLPSAPTTPNDTTGAARIFIVNGRPCFRIPLRNVLSAGRWNFYVWLQGKNGVSGYLTPNYAPLNYDVTAPAFTTLPSVTAGWTGGFVGYTNGDSLALCWEATDPSNIAEIRWKFLETTKPLNEPLQFSRRAIGAGKFCLTLPLKNNIAPNQWWYLYLWLVDGSGNSGYVNANAVYFKYDLAAPLAPSQLVNRNIGSNEWFNTRRNPLRLTLGLFDGIRDAARVRWKFQTKPGANTTFDGESALVRNGSNVNFSVSFNSTSLCGFDSLFYWLVDSAGNVNALASAFAEYRFDVCPPVITRFRSGEPLAIKRTAFTDTVRIFDHTKIVWDSLTYRFGGARATEPPRRLRRLNGSPDLFAVELPPDGVTTRGLEYKVFARDSLNNPPGAGPTTNNSSGVCGDDDYFWQAVRVRTGADGEVRIDKDGNPVALPSGNAQTNYVLFSVPFELDKNTPKDVLEDDLGAYDPKKWKFFEFRPEMTNGWVEYNSAAPTIAPFFPGRAFFMLVADANKVIDSGAGKTVSTGKRFVIELKKGWNLISNPFNFPVSREYLTLVNSKIPQDSTLGASLRSYERGWNIDNTMEPWKGYAIYVEPRRANEKINLLICPIATTPRLGKNSLLATTAKNEWTIQIAAQAGAALDTINYVGARNTAAVEYDDFDLIEPPVIGEYVSVSVPNVNWSLHPMQYTADFRPIDQEIYEWPLQVKSNAVSGEVILEFKNLANLPSGYEAYLVDAAYSMARNLKSNPSYRVVTTANGIEKSLQLLVGKPEALRKRTGGLALVPSAFELAQNFPNPFATQQAQALTAIRYALPKPATVTVEVYNMLGQKVRTLVNRQLQAADYYLANWNGRDEAGKEVSSGVYVYRLLAESGAEKFAATKKLMLVK